ncbi:hypothetical protein [Actinoplanes sp. NPDC023714]|uniref:hypothetical protein n=1 Tax=Actinoplanes sp. NPDC023714 TaxID=3154322 RepID=UPI00340492C7
MGEVPYRWDLVTPDQLGSLLGGTVAPDLWFLGELVECAGKVLARSGNGDLVFVGRSLDSMFDLLGGALDGTGGTRKLVRLPFSFQRAAIGAGRRWRRRPLTAGEVAHARHVLGTLGITPRSLARRDRPVTFVDVVNDGGTFGDLFGLLHDWIAEEREPWPVIRRKVRFAGVTVRRHTSPNTWRWQQHASWTGRLPARAVVNVSMPFPVWSYFGDHQTKLTRSYRPDQWVAEPPVDGVVAALLEATGNGPGPRRDERTRQALAEAAALVAYGRTREGRQSLARAIAGEPALSEPWLRTLVTDLNNRPVTDLNDRA